MKTRHAIELAALVILSAASARSAMAYTSVSVGVAINQVTDFYQPLASNGYWVQVPRYGYCWYPAYVASDWRPYCNGYWVWTDGGWYWESDEPWAWACYHYGRWVWDSYYGWLWIPGTVWAPSWVAWRESDDYVGWAPLSPDCDFGPDGVITGGGVMIAPSAFVFVDVHHFCEPIRPSVVIVNSTTIINKTVNVTKITYVNRTVVNNGPKVQLVQKVVGHPIEPASVHNLRQGTIAQPIVGHVEERPRPVNPFSNNAQDQPRPSGWSRSEIPRVGPSTRFGSAPTGTAPQVDDQRRGLVSAPFSKDPTVWGSGQTHRDDQTPPIEHPTPSDIRQVAPAPGYWSPRPERTATVPRAPGNQGDLPSGHANGRPFRSESSPTDGARAMPDTGTYQRPAGPSGSPRIGDVADQGARGRDTKNRRND